MTKQRLIVYCLIVVVVMGLLVTPYLLPERPESYQGGFYSLTECARFVVAPVPVVSGSDGRADKSHWMASITISNAGPRLAELRGAEIVSTFRAGVERWPVTLPNIVLRPGATVSTNLQLPATDTDRDGPRIWELKAQYRTRESKATEWLQNLHDRLPRDMQMDRFIYRPGTYQGNLVGRYPENYDSMLTNELGWRLKIIGFGLNGRGLNSPSKNPLFHVKRA